MSGRAGATSTDASVATIVPAAAASPAPPATERIVPVDGDLAEVIDALGLGDRVVASDISATYPPEDDALARGACPT